MAFELRIEHDYAVIFCLSNYIIFWSCPSITFSVLHRIFTQTLDYDLMIKTLISLKSSKLSVQLPLPSLILLEGINQLPILLLQPFINLPEPT